MIRLILSLQTPNGAKTRQVSVCHAKGSSGETGRNIMLPLFFFLFFFFKCTEGIKHPMFRSRMGKMLIIFKCIAFTPLVI